MKQIYKETRRGTKKWLLVLFLLSAAASAAPTSSPKPIKQARYIMGTMCEITAFPIAGDTASSDFPSTTAAINAAFDELKRIDALLSNWKPDSELMRLNAAAGAEVAPGESRPRVEASPELFERLQVAMRVAEQTNGKFDPTVGPLVRAWGFLPQCAQGNSCREASRSSSKRLPEARAKVGWNKVHLDRATHTVIFDQPGMEIDLGGIAKGYAADRAAQVLREHGVTSALVSLGSSSVTAIGDSDNFDAAPTEACNRGWLMLIRDPRDGRSPAATILLRDGESLATSGTYEKTVGKGANKRSHLIDPQTGEAMRGDLSVTVVIRNGELADALTKPFILMAAPESLRSPEASRLKREFPQASVILIAAKHGGLATGVAGDCPCGLRILAGERPATVSSNKAAGYSTENASKRQD